MWKESIQTFQNQLSCPTGVPLSSVAWSWMTWSKRRPARTPNSAAQTAPPEDPPAATTRTVCDAGLPSASPACHASSAWISRSSAPAV
jgi:hypothetical protein